jgi:hypothetical protein
MLQDLLQLQDPLQLLLQLLLLLPLPLQLLLLVVVLPLPLLPQLLQWCLLLQHEVVLLLLLRLLELHAQPDLTRMIMKTTTMNLRWLIKSTITSPKCSMSMLRTTMITMNKVSMFLYFGSSFESHDYKKAEYGFCNPLKDMIKKYEVGVGANLKTIQEPRDRD